MYELLTALALAVLMDRAIGEPEDRYHSTVWIGRFCNLIKSRMKNTYFQGMILLVLVTAISSGIALLLMHLSRGHFLSILLGGIILKMQFSWKGLSDYTLPVGLALEQGLEKARALLPYIVSRDTHGLNREEILSATIESIGEGTNDSIIAPLFYYLLFGSVFGLPAGISAAVFFRSVSTLDSMVGYKKEGLDRLGFFSAKCDDVLNFFPARLTALFTVLSSFILRKNFKNTLRIFVRDRNKTKSPNSGHAMAAMAGALGVRLEKPGYYSLGEPLRKLQRRDIHRAIGISNLTTVLFLFMSVIIMLR